MKKFMLLVFAALSLSVATSCHDNDYDAPTENLPAAEADVQGTWRNQNNAFYHNVKFDNGFYSVKVTNAFNPGTIDADSGSYVMSGVNMALNSLTNTPRYSAFELYWQDNSHSRLYIKPIGVFTRH